MTTVRVDCPVASAEPAPGPPVLGTDRPQPLRDRPHPVEREREFGLDEMFFSTTDSKGRITSGNRVFERVSGYTGSEMRGQPHNMIRHPDMPRSVFQLLWDYLGAGRPIAAYVKNLASDGAYYWVLATALPVSDGYLSIRIKPSTPLLGVVEGAYRELLALERSLEDEGATRRQAIDASATRLNDLVVEAGFKDYAGFMGAALAAELASREDARSDVPRNAACHSSDGTTELARILHGCSAVDRHMRSLFDALEGFARLNETLAGKAGFVRDLADAVRLLALNAMVSSARLERDGEVLGTIAGMLGVRSNAIAGVVERVGIDLHEVFELLSGLEFRISLATLQTEMTACFARELQDARAATAVAGPGVANDLALLARCLRAGAEDAFDSLQALEAALARVGTHVRRLTSGVKALGALQTGGRIEATRTDAGSFVLLFREVADQVAAARLELAEVERTAKASRAAALSRGELEARRHLAAIEESALRLESTRTLASTAKMAAA